MTEKDIQKRIEELLLTNQAVIEALSGAFEAEGYKMWLEETDPNAVIPPPLVDCGDGTMMTTASIQVVLEPIG